MFEHAFTFMSGFTIKADFQYIPETPSHRDYPGSPAEIILERIEAGFLGTNLAGMLKTTSLEDIDDHLIEAIESYLMDHFDDWYDDPYA